MVSSNSCGYILLTMSDEGTRRRTSREAHSAAHGYLHGLRASVRNNASAYGFSVTITATLALLSSIRGAPTALQIVAFAGGAVVAFAVVEMVVSWGFTQGLEDEPTDVKELGSSISVLSVGIAIGCAYVVGRLVGGLVAWPLGSFVGTASYLFLFGVELGLADRIQRRRANRRSD
jgi:undecaprenyl pyrophosphate phosphatase UppP